MKNYSQQSRSQINSCLPLRWDDMLDLRWAVAAASICLPDWLLAVMSIINCRHILSELLFRLSAELTSCLNFSITTTSAIYSITEIKYLLACGCKLIRVNQVNSEQPILWLSTSSDFMWQLKYFNFVLYWRSYVPFSLVHITSACKYPCCSNMEKRNASKGLKAMKSRYIATESLYA